MFFALSAINEQGECTMTTQTPVANVLTDEEVAQYQRDGYVIVPDLISPDEASAWKEKLKERLAIEGLLGNIPSGVRVWMADNLDPFSSAQFQSPRMTAILQQLIGPN